MKEIRFDCHVNGDTRHSTPVSVFVEDKVFSRWQETILDIMSTSHVCYHIAKNGNVFKRWVDNYNIWFEDIQAEVEELIDRQQGAGHGYTLYLDSWLWHIIHPYKKWKVESRRRYKENFADEIVRRRERNRKIREFINSLD